MPRVVTGKKSGPTEAHAGRKRPPKWGIRCWVIAGPPCRGGYKYGGLAFQVERWATGRQPVAVKILLGNLHSGIRTVTFSGF
jgi:hypothetical protein